MRKWVANNDGDLVERFYFGGHEPLGQEMADVLKAMRLEYIQLRDEMLSCKTAFPRFARQLKGLSRDYLKLYRATCLLIPWFSNDWTGDCEYKQTKDFPPDLFDELDMVLSLAEARTWD